MSNITQCLHLLHLGDRNRTTAFTALNAHSSRSHAVVMLTVIKRRRVAGTADAEIQRVKVGWCWVLPGRCWAVVGWEEGGCGTGQAFTRNVAPTMPALVIAMLNRLSLTPAQVAGCSWWACQNTRASINQLRTIQS